MAEFDEKLNSLLSNPDAMSQIFQLAQSLGGGQESQQASHQTANPVVGQNFSPPPKPFASEARDPMTSLFDDPALLLKLMPLVQELSGPRDSHARTLLYALKPYLKTERQEKIERALQLARLFHIGKKFFAEWE